MPFTAEHPKDSSHEQRAQVKTTVVVDTPATGKTNTVEVSHDDKPKTVVVSNSNSDKGKRVWNTKNLGARVAVDLASAASAAGLVAPLVVTVDRAIMENASGKSPMMTSIKTSVMQILRRPHVFFTGKPFALIFMCYGGTYFSANTLDTIKSTTDNKPASAVEKGFSKFVAVTAGNMGLSLYKDTQFTRMFGVVAPRAMPLATYGAFLVRDCLGVFAAFNLPHIIAPHLALGEAAEKYVSRASAAQLIAPAIGVFANTPFHLAGLDMYNRGVYTPLSSRIRKVRVDYLKSSVARVCRAVPAMGFGGVVNNGMRATLMGDLE